MSEILDEEVDYGSYGVNAFSLRIMLITKITPVEFSSQYINFNYLNNSQFSCINLLTRTQRKSFNFQL